MAILGVVLAVGCTSPPAPRTTLQAGDVVLVRFSGIPTPEAHSCSITPSGYITLPYTGNVYATGKTSAELEIEIKKAFLESSGWIKNADVRVTRVNTK